MPDGSRGSLLARSLVGRDAELGALQDAWRTGGATWVVTAAAGVGKSRLVRELGSWALTAGGLVLTGRCSPTGQDTPAAAVARGAARGRAGRPTPAGGPRGLRARPGAGGAGVGRRRRRPVGRSCWARRSCGCCPRGPPASTTTLLVLEDLQWADPESLAVLEYVVDNLAGAPLLVVATAARRRARARPRPGRRARRAGAPRMPCGSTPLSRRRGPGRRPVVPRRGRPARRRRRARWWRAATGCRSSSRSCCATAVRSGWDTIADDVPGSVAASVATRLGDLPPAARPLLTAAALLGRHFDWTLAATPRPA